MESLAFIYGYVTYNDPDPPEVRSLKEIGNGLSTLASQSAMGAALVVLMATQSPADAALVPGETCSAVGAAQYALQERGYPVGGVDDVFGSSTAAAVEQFQSNTGLVVDGIIGPATASALGLDPTISCGGGGGGGSNGSAYVQTSGGPLNVRSGPGLGYGIIDSLPDGASLTIVNQQGNWGQLPDGGWVSLSFVAYGSGGGGGNSGGSAVDTNGGELNVRSGPGQDYDIIGELPDGASVDIVAQQGNWGQLASGGWVSLSWIIGY